MNRLTIFIIGILLLAIFFVSLGNGRGSANTQPTPTAFPTAISILDPPQTLEEVQELLLPDDTCQLPCFWGFRPDFTTSDEVLSFTRRQDEFAGLDSFDVDYYFEDYREPKLTIIFLVESNMLEAMEITIMPGDWLPVGTFELSELLARMPSQPDEIYIMLTPVLGVVVMPVYADNGVVVHYQFHLKYPGDRLDHQARTPLYLCPTFDSDNEIFDESVRLWLQNDIGQAFLERYAEIEQGTSNRYWSVERMTGLTVAEFVEQVTEQSDECIELPSMPELREQGYEF
jgi:hypothetical protein